jgi:hypothetical protein
MAEITLDMYGAIGRFGNRTYYQRGGKTITRTITTPKNPKIEAQSLSRVLLKAVNKLKEICDLCSLAKAVEYSYKTPIDMESECCLNNAGGK